MATIELDELPGRLRHVRWLGGGSGAGKSTVARALATQYGLCVYSTDDVMTEHARRCPREHAPALQAFAAMSMDERWLHRSPQVMLETFHWFRGECFDLIVEDLLRLPQSPSILVEGFRLLPRLVEPLLTGSRRAVWLLPTPEFRRMAIEARGSVWEIAGRTSDPPRALRNLLERDRLFTERLRKETRRSGLPAIEVVRGMPPDELSRRVAATLELGGCR